ncbi:MAG: response regulator [Sphingobium sp.]|nr:response regulator [Sphingobium sp.]
MIFGRELLTRVTGGRERAIRTILVVEDEPLVAFDNEHMLAQAGYSVAATVDDYDHAIAAIDAGGIDLVIADISLRGDRDGIDVARYAAAAGLPVLFVTGACPVDAQALAVGCLAKPYSQRDLLLAIEVADALVRSAKPPRPPAGMRLFPRAA